MRLRERIRVGVIGLGWVGREVARAALEDPRVTLSGIADVDPVKAGRDLGEIIGEGRIGIRIDGDVRTMLSRVRPEVVVLATTSSVEALVPDVEACVECGTHIVTTCENLADLESALPFLPGDLVRRIEGAKVVVLATGVNPGFAMDRLPVTLAQATRNIRRVRVVRTVDAARRRAQLQAKIGVGMEASAFAEAIRTGKGGHAGLSCSLRLLARGLGISLDKTSETVTPLIAEDDMPSVLGTVAKDRVKGVYQVARGYRQRREVITLELRMALGQPNPRDVIDIVGEPPLRFEGELPGDECTVATVLSAISVVASMQPGLRTVLEVPLEQPELPEGTTDAPRGRDGTLPPALRGDAARTERPASARKKAPPPRASKVKGARAAVKKKAPAKKPKRPSNPRARR